MKFKVYQGPMEVSAVYNGVEYFLAPNCTEKNCRERIEVWMSDRYCFNHAILSVKEHDRKMNEEESREN